MFVLHADGELALAFRLSAVFADDGAGKDFDFGDKVGRVRGVGEHGFGEIFFVAVVAYG